MKNLNIKYFLYILLSISFLFYLLILKFQQPINGNTLIEYVKIIPKVVTCNLLFIFIFSKWLWKWRIFKGWLMPFPNLNGTWRGLIQTTWIDPKTNERPSPIPVILSIYQKFLSVNCIMRTKEMSSYSFSADFLIDKESNLKRLVYSYHSNPNQIVNERSANHSGTIIFDIIEKPEKKMFGDYWTSRKTTGNIDLTYWKKEQVDHYPDEIGEHPVSYLRNNKG